MLLTFYMLCFNAQQIMIMSNHNVPINIFINNRKFTEANNLMNLLGNNDATEEITQVKLFPYLEMHELRENCTLQKAT